jgi:hypothetical protein
MTLLDGLLLAALYDALPTLLRSTVYFLCALFILFVLFLLVKYPCHAIKTMFRLVGLTTIAGDSNTVHWSAAEWLATI